MNDSRSYITLDFRNTHMPVVVKVKRGDTARTLYISLADGGTPYQISDGCTATFTAKKPDKTVINNSCTIEGNMIVYPFTDQTCSKDGRMTAEIRLYGSNGKMLTSASFVLEIHKTVLGPNDIPASESQMNALDALILETTALKTETKALKEEVERKLENGEFNGEPGRSPVRGVDYWTDADKAEIAAHYDGKIQGLTDQIDENDEIVNILIDAYSRLNGKVNDHQKTLDEQGERIADLVVLSDFELEMLNELLLNGTLRCAPEITATYNATNGVDPETDFAVYFYDVSATIKNIDKALIKKVEVGVGTKMGSTTSYEWFDAESSFGDGVHTVDFSGKYLNFSGYFRPAVRLTYYHPLAGEEQILMVEAVKE